MNTILKEGIILKGVGGFYYIKTAEGEIYTCRAKGNFRNEKIVPFVGDYAAFRISGDGEGYIEKIFDRRNFLERPPIANIARLIIVSSLSDPVPDRVFIDKLLVICEYKNIEPVLCFHKSDLKSDRLICDDYRALGYATLTTSVVDGGGIDLFKDFMQNGVTAVAGFSGVGKSSLLNTVGEAPQLKIGDVSKKLNRGKHTTRHVEIHPLSNGAYFADTPGFSNINIELVRKEELGFCFVEMRPFINDCKFSGCSHTKERGCAVREALEEGKILQSRYDNYCMFYEQLKQIPDWERTINK